MSNRDELDGIHASLLAGVKEQPDYASGAVPSVSAYSEGAEHALDTVRAAGYRKPRTITTAEELDALPQYSVIIDKEGVVWEYKREVSDKPAWWCSSLTGFWFSSNLAAFGESGLLPATVIHEPKEAE